MAKSAADPSSMGTTTTPLSAHPKNTADPLSAVLAPHHHPIAFGNPARLQLARKAERHFQNFAVGKRFRPIAAPLPVSALLAVRLKMLREEFRNRFGHV